MRLDEFWTALRDRIDTPRLQLTLGGRGRVYRPTDDFPLTEAQPDEPWGRVVMLPRATLWPQALTAPDDWEQVSILLSVQFNDFRAKTYNVDIPIAEAHREILAQLDDWVPDPQPAHVLIVLPVYRYSPPPAAAIFDQARNLLLSNAEYRTNAVPR